MALNVAKAVMYVVVKPIQLSVGKALGYVVLDDNPVPEPVISVSIHLATISC